MLAPMMRDIIQTEYFRVVVVDDEDAVEICGALKVMIGKYYSVIQGDIDMNINVLFCVRRTS